MGNFVFICIFSPVLGDGEIKSEGQLVLEYKKQNFKVILIMFVPLPPSPQSFSV